MTTTTHEPMPLADLILWVADHQHTMYPERNRPSEQFHAIVTEVTPGTIPDYALLRIDPGSIIAGEKDDEVFIRFSYYNGSNVTLYPWAGWQPTVADWIERMACEEES